MNLLELFCHVDDFTKTFVIPKPEKALPNSKKTRERLLSMSASEIMILVPHQHLVSSEWDPARQIGTHLDLRDRP